MTQLNIQASPEKKALRQALMRMTPAEAEAYIEANVTNLATAKAVLKILAKAIVVLAKENRHAQ